MGGEIGTQLPQIINTCIFVTEGERGQKRVEGRGGGAPPAPWHRKFFGSRGRTSLGPGQPHSSLTLPCRGRWTQCCRLFLRRCTEVSCADPRFPAPDKMSRQLSPDFTKSKTGLTTSREYLRWWEERDKDDLTPDANYLIFNDWFNDFNFNRYSRHCQSFLLSLNRSWLWEFSSEFKFGFLTVGQLLITAAIIQRTDRH